ncbi:MAG: holo-ACP synthase [Coriobacteriia bacterium]|nr:holo-ACP synthase [Coriobacteriia bacterium]
MSVIGVGLDIVPIERIERAMNRTPGFIDYVFTSAEQKYCNKKALPQVHYAARFAAREAVLKALGCGIFSGIKMKDLEVLLDKNGAPYMEFSGRAKQIMDEKGIVSVQISLSHTSELAIANAVAITEMAIPAKESKESAKEQLTKNFKEARLVLDELDELSKQASFKVSSKQGR